MSSLSHTYGPGLNLTISNPFSAIIKALDRFYRSKEITKTAKIFHGNFSYDLVPDTSISTFTNMPKVTSVDCGACYIAVFEGDCFQGEYHLLDPGSKAQIGNCGSAIISLQPIPIDTFRKNARSPAWFWELTGPMYVWHFCSTYKYA